MSLVKAGKRTLGNLFSRTICTRSIAKFATKDELPNKDHNVVARSPEEQQEHFELLTNLCTFVFDTHKPDAETLEKEKRVKNDLRHCCWSVWGKQTKVELFGSAANGFGFKNSDLDYFVWPVKKHAQSEKYKSTASRFIAVSMGNKLVQKLFHDRLFTKILWIKHCRVPLISCIHKPTHMKLDITFNNEVVARNTLLLSRYTAIDRRCQILGFAMKLLSKAAGIADTQTCFLSSYSYNLMVIYYLQQLNDPVLPQLQKIGQRRSIPCGKHETWFYNGDLKDVWPGMGSNTQSIGELWLGFLHFYAFEFDYNIDSVCIAGLHHKRPQGAGVMTIRDPFELSRNLASQLRKRNTEYIIDFFRHAYHHFNQTPPSNLTNESLMKHYFTVHLKRNKRRDGPI